MRSVKMVAAAALLTGGVAFGASQVVYTLELGGDNHADQWEAFQEPDFTQGVTSGVIEVGDPSQGQKEDLTWAVRVSVGGAHDGEPGNGYRPFGAANLVFDLELYKDGVLVDTVGAATLVANGADNVPSGPGFWSSINDGDANGTRGGGGLNPDLLANAAFARAINNTGSPYTGPFATLIDGRNHTPSGPNFDYGWYPTANGRGGVDIGGTKPVVAVNDPALGGKLVGFGAGYKSYEYTNYQPGVGKLYFSDASFDYGFGAYIDDLTPGYDNPLAPPQGEVEKALFEGQLSVRGLAPGTYTLKVVPSAEGNNVLHGQILWDSATPNYNGFGSFAAKANEVHALPANGVDFIVNAPPGGNAEVVGRYVFYNQSAFDGNRATIDAGPNAGGADDGDAVDTSKAPLLVGGGISTFVNYTSYRYGLNGLVYDVKSATRAPTVGDFTFTYLGRTGAMAPVAKVPTAFAVWPGAGTGGADRVLIAFANEDIANGWLQVDIGTGFGAPAESHWWGNAQGEAQDNAANLVVNSLDLGKIKANYKNPGQAPVEWVWDFDKNKACNSLDVGYAKSKYVSPALAVQRITR